MGQSPNIYQRMLAVQRAVSYIQKEDRKVNNQYRFVSHDAVAKKTRQPLIDNGVYFQPVVTQCERDGNMTIVTMESHFVNSDAPDDRITIRTVGYGIDPQDKGAGKAMSYAVKYALLKGLNLETGEDPDQDDYDREEPQPKATRKATPKDNNEPDVNARLDKAVAAYAALGTGIKVADMEAHLGPFEEWGPVTLQVLTAAYNDVKRGREFGEAIDSKLRMLEREEE